jgi:hypothetical protein
MRERGAIVAWLRTSHRLNTLAGSLVNSLANVIERGDHLNELPQKRSPKEEP